ncbi:MAG: bifunctional oligoribonuclease/PAP phosphatase NrnA [Lentimicrobium sp.]|nr:bifunctional oligoribonuclease/PAP phosphatase NrnA [Lentimicrobium sp.]
MQKFNPDTLNSVKQLLDVPAEIVVTSHYNPDGDALGSALALSRYLRKKGHKVTTIIPNDFPDFLHWMPGQKDILIYFHKSLTANELIKNASIIFCLDYNAIPRVNLFADQLFEAKGIKVLIDHHLAPEDHFDYSLSVIKTSSTSELIFDFIDNLGDNDLIDADIAVCLYVGMMTDTGSFSFACNYPHTYEVVAKLVKAGVDTERVHRLVYDTYSESRMRLLGFCLSERMIVLGEYGTAYIYLSRQDLQKFDFKSGDTEGVVNYALSIRDISFAALFTEKSDRIRISFRSKGSFSVNDFAREHYQGGGHRNAAGGDAFQPLETTLKNFEELLPVYQERILLAAKESSVLNP